MNTKSFIFWVITIHLLIQQVCGSESWDMPMAYPASNFQSQHGIIFAQKVKDYTQGQININVHPGGSLIQGGAIKDAVATGQVQIGERFMSAHAKEAPILAWDSLPFLAMSYEDNERLWSIVKDEVNQQLADMNLTVLYTCPWPGQGFYFNKEVNSSADTQGIKFRTYNPATSTIAKALGMTPVRVKSTDILQALSSGKIDGFVASGSTGYQQKVWQKLSHYYPLNAWFPRNYVIMNKSVYQRLSEDNKRALHKAANETALACAAKSAQVANWTIEQLQSHGLVIANANPTLMKELSVVGNQLQKEWQNRVGNKGTELLTKYKKTSNA